MSPSAGAIQSLLDPDSGSDQNHIRGVAFQGQQGTQIGLSGSEIHVFSMEQATITGPLTILGDFEITGKQPTIDIQNLTGDLRLLGDGASVAINHIDGELTVRGRDIEVTSEKITGDLLVQGYNFQLSQGIVQGQVIFGSVSNAQFYNVTFQSLLDFKFSNTGTNAPTFIGGEINGQLANQASGTTFKDLIFNTDVAFDEKMNLENVIFAKDLALLYPQGTDTLFKGGEVRGDLSLSNNFIASLNGVRLRGKIVTCFWRMSHLVPLTKLQLQLIT